MTHLRWATVLTTLTLALAACADDEPEPRVDPTPTTSSTQSTSPSHSVTTPASPSPPGALEHAGTEGARAFVVYFWEVVDYAQRTLDIEALRALTMDQCEACQGALQFLQGVIDDGGKIEGGDGTVAILDAKRLTAGSRESVSVTFDLTTTRQVVDAPGKRNDQFFPAATVRNRFVVDQLSGDWRLGLWEVLS
jgi:hypothetical protein